MSQTNAPIIIIGSGHAGYTVAKQLRERDDAPAVTVITADDGANYYKPMLSNALGGGKAPGDLARESADEVAERLGIEVVTHCAVDSIDRANRRVETDRGDRDYARLVLAMGAEPITPPIGGDAAAEVLQVNNLADYRVFRDHLGADAHVAIIGNGLIGCEFANDMVRGGHAVTLIGLTGWPMDTLMPERAGRRLQEALTEKGVDWRLENTVEAVDRDGAGYRLTLADSATVEADLVLSAIGLRPRTELARRAGLAVDRGIRVDTCLRTSDPAIFALGDCVQLGDRMLPYIAPIDHAAKALVPGLMDDPTPVDFPPMPVLVKTPAHPVHVLPPAPGQQGGWTLDEDDSGVRGLFHDAAGRLAGFVLTGMRVRERMKLVRECDGVLPPELPTRID